MIVHVTQDDIDQGVMCSTDGCAIACALHRLGLEGARVEGVRVPSAAIVLASGREIPLSRVAQRWAVRFDDGKDVEPFSFEIEAQP